MIRLPCRITYPVWGVNPRQPKNVYSVEKHFSMQRLWSESLSEKDRFVRYHRVFETSTVPMTRFQKFKNLINEPSLVKRQWILAIIACILGVSTSSVIYLAKNWGDPHLEQLEAEVNSWIRSNSTI